MGERSQVVYIKKYGDSSELNCEEILLPPSAIFIRCMIVFVIYILCKVPLWSVLPLGTKTHPRDDALS